MYLQGFGTVSFQLNTTLHGTERLWCVAYLRQCVHCVMQEATSSPSSAACEGCGGAMYLAQVTIYSVTNEFAGNVAIIGGALFSSMGRFPYINAQTVSSSEYTNYVDFGFTLCTGPLAFMLQCTSTMQYALGHNVTVAAGYFYNNTAISGGSVTLHAPSTPTLLRTWVFDDNVALDALQLTAAGVVNKAVKSSSGLAMRSSITGSSSGFGSPMHLYSCGKGSGGALCVVEGNDRCSVALADITARSNRAVFGGKTFD